MGRWSAARALRVAKYGFAAPVIGAVIRNSSLLDGLETPPAAINFAGGGDFVAVGDRQVDLFALRAGLGPEDRVLEIGCGIGRIATALARRSPRLDYVGFDIVGYGIDWSRKRLTQFPGFRFFHADLRNSFYNPFGRLQADRYRFPAADGTCDLVFATSVFTHLLEPATAHYLAEAARVLAPGGRLYLTTFLAPADPAALAPDAALRFDHRAGAARLASAAEPELAVGYDLAFWTQLGARTGLHVSTVFGGSWAGGQAQDGQDFQDGILMEKTGDAA